MNDSRATPTDLITPTKAAQILELHVATIYRWIFSGKLPGWRVGRKVRVSRADLDAMVEPIKPKAGKPRAESACERVAVEAWIAREEKRLGLAR